MRTLMPRLHPLFIDQAPRRRRSTNGVWRWTASTASLPAPGATATCRLDLGRVASPCAGCVIRSRAMDSPRKQSGWPQPKIGIHTVAKGSIMFANSTEVPADTSVVLADPESDSELAARFERDVTPLRNRLFGAAIRFTHNQQDAEDLVQETILNAYAGFRRFRQGTDLMAWLYRIMRNTWINHWRKQRRRATEVPVGRITDDQLAAYASHGANDLRSAELAALDAVPDAEIAAALMTLHEAFRLTVYYADIEGRSNREIADLMNTPLGTVMSRLHRSRLRLRTQLSSVADQRGYGCPRDTLAQAAS